MKTMFLVFAVVVLGTVHVCAQKTETHPVVLYEFSDAERFWYLAKKAIEDGNFQRAKFYLAEASEKDPSLTDNRYFKADCERVERILEIRKEVIEKSKR